jgi:hypothetical protein
MTFDVMLMALRLSPETKGLSPMKIVNLLLAGSLIVPGALAITIAKGEAAVTDHSHDFDFLVGKWRVHHWRLKERLANSHDWIEFEGTSQLWLTLNGHGTVDDNYIGLPSGPYRAMGFRCYDPKTQMWRIWWLDERDPVNTVASPPVMGNITDGAGVFESPDTFNGKPIVVRYTWSKITHNSAHWEQAFSPDGGKTWETNWRMDLTRMK